MIHTTVIVVVASEHKHFSKQFYKDASFLLTTEVFLLAVCHFTDRREQIQFFGQGGL